MEPQSDLKRLNKSYLGCCTLFANNKSLMQDIMVVHDYTKQLISYANEYDYPGVEANGFRTCIEIALRLLEYGVGHCDPDEDEPDFAQFVKLLANSVPLIDGLRNNTLKNPRNPNGTVSLMDSDSTYTAKCFAQLIDSNGCDVALGRMSGFFCDFPENYLSWISHFFIACAGGGNIFNFIAGLFDSDLRTRFRRRIMNNMHVDHLKWIDIIGDSWYVRTVPPLGVPWGYFHPTIVRTIYVPRQKRFQIEVNAIEQTAKLVRHSAVPLDEYEKKNSVRTRFMLDEHRKKPNLDKVVIIHVHGGGFVMGSPEAHESYTRYWVNETTGIPWFSVDYGLAPEHQFPVGIQQLVDVFLWLNGRECEDLLGYKPRKFVCVGDSSGGMMLMAMSNVLNDIRKNYPKDGAKYVFPTGFVGVYPSFTCSPRSSPSLLLASIHPELFPAAFVNMLTAYVPYTDETENRKYVQAWKKENRSRWWRFIKFFLPRAPEDEWTAEKTDDGRIEKLWWNQTAEIAKEKVDNWLLLTNPYVSPLFYDDFESMKEMRISLLVVNTDPILDHAISLANKWKGEVTLKVFTDVVHGFLPFLFAKGKYKEHNDTVVSELKRIICYRH